MLEGLKKLFKIKTRKSLGHYGGKWGANITLGTTQEFLKAVADNDYIIVYNINMMLHGLDYIPMWDNKDKTQYDFIIINKYNIEKYIPVYEPPIGKELYRPPYLFTDGLLGIRQYQEGGIHDKDKLYPYLYIRYNSKTEKCLAYNSTKNKLYVLNEDDIKDYKKEFKYKITKVFYIHEGSLKGVKDRYPEYLPWTFNWERTRTPKEKVTVLPPEHYSDREDVFMFNYV